MRSGQKSGKFYAGRTSISPENINPIIEDIFNIGFSMDSIDIGTGSDGKILSSTITYDPTSDGVKLIAKISKSDANGVPPGSYNYFVGYYNSCNEVKSMIGIDGVTYDADESPATPLTLSQPSEVDLILKPFTGSYTEASKITGINIYRFKSGSGNLVDADLVIQIPTENLYQTIIIKDTVKQTPTVSSSNYFNSIYANIKFGIPTTSTVISNSFYRKSVVNCISAELSTLSNDYISYSGSFICKSQSFIKFSDPSTISILNNQNSKLKNQTENASLNYGLGSYPINNPNKIFDVWNPAIFALYAKDYIDLTGIDLTVRSRWDDPLGEVEPVSSGGIVILSAPHIILPSGASINLNGTSSLDTGMGGGGGGMLVTFSNSIITGATITTTGGTSVGGSPERYAPGSGGLGGFGNNGQNGFVQHFRLGQASAPQF